MPSKNNNKAPAKDNKNNGLGNALYTKILRQTLFPLFMMFVTPNAAILLPHIIIHHKASLLGAFKSHSVTSLLWEAWSKANLLDVECWTIIGVSLLFGYASVRYLPGRKYQGPPAMNNFRPTYYDNAVLFYFLYVAAVMLVICNVKIMHFYYKLPTFFACLTVFGLLFCAFLYLKGILAPSPGENGLTGYPLFDYYWGVELYPCIGSGTSQVSLKVLINCRFGLALWQAAALVACKMHYEFNQQAYQKYGLYALLNPVVVCAVIQTVYLAKFYWWEDGYMQTIDIALDRFGYYVCWGCIAWVPSFYPLHSYFMINLGANQSAKLDYYLIFVLVFGLLSIALNYYVDYERKLVRDTDGDCRLFGKKPVLVRAKYRDSKGQTRNSILLASGTWALARHLNYLFELCVALSFGLPAGFSSPLPYFYFFFLTGLLIHREHRDNEKCKEKYGKYWEEYCKLVPYRIVPFVY